MAGPAIPMLGVLLRSLGARVGARLAMRTGTRAAAGGATREGGGGLLGDLLGSLLGRGGQEAGRTAAGAAEAAGTKTSEVIREVVREGGYEAASRAVGGGGGAAGGEQGSAMDGPPVDPAGGESGRVPTEQPSFAEVLRQPGAFGDILAAGVSGRGQDKVFEIQQKLRADRESLRLQTEQNEQQERSTEQLKTFGSTLAGVAGAAVPLVLGLDKLGERAIASQERFGEFNGVIAGAMAQLEVDRINRSIEFAGEVSASAAALARSQSRLEDALLPTQSFVQNLYNSVLAALSESAARGVEATTPILENVLEEAAAPTAGGLVQGAQGLTNGLILGEAMRRLLERVSGEDKDRKPTADSEPAFWQTMREYADRDEPVYNKKLKRKMDRMREREAR